nr:reverse transcriptase domain-containing protein [Tanacetum cinerariifolium]
MTNGRTTSPVSIRQGYGIDISGGLIGNQGRHRAWIVVGVCVQPECKDNKGIKTHDGCHIKKGNYWSWKIILRVRGLIRDHIVSEIGDGKGTSLWFDNWHPICTLSSFITKRKIHYSGLSLKAKIADILTSENGSGIKFFAMNLMVYIKLSFEDMVILINYGNDRKLNGLKMDFMDCTTNGVVAKRRFLLMMEEASDSNRYAENPPKDGDVKRFPDRDGARTGIGMGMGMGAGMGIWIGVRHKDGDGRDLINSILGPSICKIPLLPNVTYILPRVDKATKDDDTKCRSINYCTTSEQDDQGGDRGNEANGGVDEVPDFSTVIAQQLQNLLPTIISQVELELELWCHAMVGAGYAAYTDRFHELARLVPHLVTPKNKRIKRYIYRLALQTCRMVEAIELTTIQSVILKSEVLTDKAIRNESWKKNSEKRGNGTEPSKDGNVTGDNKRSRTRKAFAITTKTVRKEYTGLASKCTNYKFHNQPEAPCRTYTICNHLGHFARDCRKGTKTVNPLNAKNPIAARRACFECGGTNHYKATRPRLN